MPGSAVRRKRARPFPKLLGRYELILPIASGGMATVYLGRATGMAGFEREVAIKLTHDHLRDEPAFTTALIDEARFAGRIRHPNVVSVLDVAECAEGVFIVMDYVEGDSLAGIAATLADQGRQVPIEVALKILDDMLAGLHAAHELRDPSGRSLDLVHRDVTPHNVLLGVDGVARLTDFGVATAARRMTKTQTGLVKGKLTYMSPEQVRAQPLDRTCDVWAAGVIAWELLSGRRLYEGVNDAALLLKIARELPPPLRHIRPDLPLEITRAVHGALVLAKSERYATAEQFGETLARAARLDGIAAADVRVVKSFAQPLLEPILSRRRHKLVELHSQLDPATEVLPRPSDPPAGRRSAHDLRAGLSASSPVMTLTQSEPRIPLSSPGATESDYAPAQSTTDPTLWTGPRTGPEHTATFGAAMELPDGALRPSQTPPAPLGVHSKRSWFWVALFVPLVLIALVWVVFVMRVSGPEPAATSAPDGTVAPAAVAASAPPAPPAAPGTSRDDEPLNPEDLPMAAPDPSDTPAVRPPSWRPPRPVAPAQPKPAATEPAVPLDNPYPDRR